MLKNDSSTMSEKNIFVLIKKPMYLPLLFLFQISVNFLSLANLQVFVSGNSIVFGISPSFPSLSGIMSKEFPLINFLPLEYHLSSF